MTNEKLEKQKNLVKNFKLAFTYLTEIVEIVFPVDPVVARIGQAVGLVPNVSHVRPFTVEQRSFEKLNAKNAEDHEEGTADQHDVTDGPQRAKQRLYNQLQAGRPIDDSV